MLQVTHFKWLHLHGSLSKKGSTEEKKLLEKRKKEINNKLKEKTTRK